MDSNAVKSLWIRGKSYEMLKEWDKSIDALAKACKVEPTNVDFRKGLE